MVGMAGLGYNCHDEADFVPPGYNDLRADAWRNRTEVAMLKAFMTVNHLSILTAGVAAWMFGGLYYSLLSRPWMAAQGKTMEDCKAEMAGKSKLAIYGPFVLAFVAALFMAWALYGVLLHLNRFTVRGGMISAVLIWFGFVLTTMAVNNAFHGRKAMLTVIDSLHWLGGLIIIGAVVGWFGP
jgi:hypothetical protein